MVNALNVNLLILISLAVAALYTVMARSLIRAALGLAITSAVLSILIFRLESPLAAVFELSVCSGLITVIFMTTISLTKPRTMTEVYQHMMDRLSRFWYLPLIVGVMGIALGMMRVKVILAMPSPETITDVRTLMWATRKLDLIGQAVVLLVGGLGIALLFRERRKK